MNIGQKYDIFISYRRTTGANAARMMQLALTARGYSAFFDYSSLKDGKFNEAIYSAIDSCEVFILMMTEGALDRCAEEGDWVRLEIQRAIEKGKHIVPIRPSDQAWEDFPANLPKELSTICREQVSKLDMETLFESSLDEIENYRFSKELRARRRQPGAGMAGDDYLSSVTHAGEVFVGRDLELNALAKMLSEQKVPVITGAGGMGKSELVRQYAVRCRDAYPGGRFQVDMETARTWNDVFEKLLAGKLGNGQFVRDLLDDRKDGEKSLPLDVGQALLRRAKRLGAVLLFLDNVESVGAFVGRDGQLTTFTTDFADGVRLDIVMTARTSDVTFRPTGRVVELSLGGLSPAAAQELLLKDWPEAGEAERKAAGRVAELLGYRALYLQRVPALIGDVTAPVICDSFTELERELRKNLLETVAAGTEEDHWPEALWEMTRKRLLALKPLGPACVKLAQVASYFSPDGFPQHVLRHLWKTFAPPEYKDNFGRALSILQRHGVFQSVELVRIHRINREVILQTTKAESGLEDALGATLADYGLLSLDDWLHLCVHEGVRMHLPTELSVDGRFWFLLLSEWPKLADYCPWERLGGRDWTNLLRVRPQFADHCPWEKLDDGDWPQLLCAQPQFADHCPWEKLDGRDWTNLLRVRPQFADRCPWEKLDGGDWSQLLRTQPKFVDRCPREKLDGTDWMRLLRSQPQLAEHCTPEKLSGRDWASLLCDQPLFAVCCAWEKLDGMSWGELLCIQPQFAAYCSWEKLAGCDWAWLLRERPQFADRCIWGLLNGDDWASLLGDQPQFAERCPWEELSGRDWSWLLRSQPQFSDHCAWEKLNGEDWHGLLQTEPGFADRCPWGTLDGATWRDVLIDLPQFAEHCPWEKLEGWAWMEVLANRPQFAVRCPWEKLSDKDWEELLSVQPQFAKWRKNKSAENHSDNG